MKLPKHVTICEVGTRDGFQIEPEFIPTEQKIEVVNRLSACGIPRIEVTSFVHPKAVPQLRDAEEVMAGINLDRLIETARHVEQVVRRTLPGQIMKAGKWDRRYPVPDSVHRRLAAG